MKETACCDDFSLITYTCRSFFLICTVFEPEFLSKLVIKHNFCMLPVPAIPNLRLKRQIKL